jgi:glycogen synthase
VIPNGCDGGAPTVGSGFSRTAVGSAFGRTAVGSGFSRTDDVSDRDRDNIVFTAGRLWDPAKNVDAVCTVASAIEWPVYVAGDHQRPGAAQRDDLASCQNVHLLGRLPQGALLAWMQQAAIYALPARYEPFGLSILEAGVAGCALVLGDIDSLREVWADAAVYVPPDDPAALRAALRHLIIDQRQRQDLGIRAQSRARQFTAARMANGYLDAYRAVLSFAAV